MTAPLKSRFESKVSVTGGCWIWLGAKDGCGYGSIKHEGKALRAHRVSYEIYCSSIPKGMHVLHRCDNPACVNPDHLFLGTHLDNMKDMYSKNRRAAATGLRNGAAKLSQERIMQIVQSKVPSERLSSSLGVSGSRIRAIRRAHAQSHF